MRRDVLYLTLGAVGWVLAIYNTVAWLRDPKNPSLKWIVLMLSSIGMVMTWSSPWLYKCLDHTLHKANLSIAVIYTSVIAFLLSTQQLLSDWASRGDDETRRAMTRRAGISTGVISVAWLAALTGWALGRPDVVEHPTDFSTVYTGSPGVMLFLLTYVVVFGGVMAMLGSLCRQYAVALGSARPWASRGLRLVSIGAWAILVYCAGKITAIVGPWTGVHLDTVGDTLAPFSASLGALFVALGLAVPAIGSQATAWWRVRRLRSLWQAAIAMQPEVSLGRRWERAASREVVAIRQMAEIRDVQQGIRGLVEARLVAVASEHGKQAGLDEQEVAALIEAAALRRGASNRAAGHIPTHAAPSTIYGGGVDLIDEYQHLVRVADAYHCDLVRRVLAAVPPRVRHP